jgi:hypothetical protein
MRWPQRDRRHQSRNPANEFRISKGGKYLLLPPSYAEKVPTGYHMLHSPTYDNLFFWRGFLDAGSTATVRRALGNDDFPLQ